MPQRMRIREARLPSRASLSWHFEGHLSESVCYDPTPQRANGRSRPQFLPIGCQPLLLHTLEALHGCPLFIPGPSSASPRPPVEAAVFPVSTSPTGRCSLCASSPCAGDCGGYDACRCIGRTRLDSFCALGASVHSYRPQSHHHTAQLHDGSIRIKKTRKRGTDFASDAALGALIFSAITPNDTRFPPFSTKHPPGSITTASQR
jgi:hypothetical protein